MNRKYRFVLYFLLCLSILTFPYIADICIDVWGWLNKTINTNCLFALLCIAGIFLFIEFLIHTCKKEQKNNADKYKTIVSSLYYDSPSSNDIFKRRSYARLLLNKIYSSFYINNNQEHIAKHSFVIHLGEHYGQGKTSFLMMLEEEIKEEIPVVYIKFEPWLCDTELGIIQEFFSTFREYVGRYLPKIDNTVKEYIFLLLSSIGYSNSGFSFNLENVVKKNNRTLKETHDKIRDELQKIDRPVIITIDVVDRLQSKELMMVLKIIRDTADFPNVYYIVAADNIHLKKMLNIQNIDDAETYLEKFFNLEFLLPANENVAYKEMLRLVANKLEELQIENKNKYVEEISNVPYIREAFPNLRDVYRFVNAYFLTIDSMSMSDVRQLNLYDLFLLTLIRTQNLEYYIQLRDNSLNVLNIVKKDNDFLLEWKGELNIVKQRQDKIIIKHLKEVQKKDKGFASEQEQLNEEDLPIPNFEDTTERSKITSNTIVPEIMNILFGKTSNRIESNQICRYNMYFKYFANTNASYMVSRMQVVTMLKSDEEVYRKELDQQYKDNKDKIFLSELTYALPFVTGNKDVCLLKRFFIFIEFAYKYQRDITISDIIHSQAEYESGENNKLKLYTILNALYSSTKYPPSNEVVKEKRNDFFEMCETYTNINILLVCLDVISCHLGLFIFNRDDVDKMSQKLVERFFEESIVNNNGHISYQEADTITQIKKISKAESLWNEKFDEYLLNNKEACLNIFSKLVRFYPTTTEWDFDFLVAILGQYKMQENNILLQLAEKYSEDKDVFSSLLNLHNHFAQTLQHVSGLENEAFIRMAKSRNDIQ